VRAFETRDGFAGGAVVEDLFDVSVALTARVWRGNTGLLTFGYDYAASANFGLSGSLGFSADGFAGYDLDYGYVLNFTAPYQAAVSRSTDGDTLSFGHFAPEDPLPINETFLFVTDAPTYAFSGNAVLNVEIDTFGTTPRAVGGLPVPAAIPVPASLPLMGFALLLMGLLRRRP